MKNQEWHKNRISELKFKRKEFSFVRNTYTPTLLAFSTLFIIIFNQYSENKQIGRMLFSTLLWGFVLITLGIIYKIANKRIDNIDEKIQRNYDILLRKSK